MSEKVCDVVGCEKKSQRTVAASKASKVFNLKTKATKIHLCKEHYKEFKKKTKQDRTLERLAWR